MTEGETVLITMPGPLMGAIGKILRKSDFRDNAWIVKMDESHQEVIIDTKYLSDPKSIDTAPAPAVNMMFVPRTEEEAAQMMQGLNDLKSRLAELIMSYTMTLNPTFWAMYQQFDDDHKRIALDTYAPGVMEVVDQVMKLTGKAV